MTSAPTAAATRTVANDDPSWPAAGRFVQGLTDRDFAALRTYLHPHVRFRAVVPRGPFEVIGAEAAASQFESWFGEYALFEVLDAAIGQVGTRMYMRWRLRVAQDATPCQGQIVEQHVFVTGADRIESLDLLCSGFQPESPTAHHR